MRVDQAAETGDRLTLLLALRERLASAIADEDCPARDLAALSLRLMGVAKEITELEELIRQQEIEKGRVRGVWRLEDAV